MLLLLVRSLGFVHNRVVSAVREKLNLTLPCYKELSLALLFLKKNIKVLPYPCRHHHCCGGVMKKLTEDNYLLFTIKRGTHKSRVGNSQIFLT